MRASAKLGVDVTAALAAILCGAALAPSADEQGACVLLTGADSVIGQPRVVLVTAPQEWASLWLEHRGLPEDARYDFFFNRAGVPEVDFATHVVVAVFSGSLTNAAGLKLDALETAEGRTTLRYAAKSYQTLVEPGAEAAAARPFGLFVVPRFEGPLQVEEQLYSMLGPSRVEARASFPTPPAPK